MAKLTDRTIQSIKGSDKDIFTSAGGGLYLRVRKSGTKFWLYRYKSEAATKWMDLGEYPILSLADATDLARQATKQRKLGIDPLEHRAEVKAAVTAAAVARKAEQEAVASRLTVNALLERWERTELKARKDEGAEIRRSFEKDVLPTIGQIAAENVTRKMVASILDSVVIRGAPIVARNLLGDIRQMFSFAIKRGLLDSDPTSHLKRNDYGKKVERDRTLSEAEIKELIFMLPKANLQKSTELAIWIMLSTCCRIGELSKAKWTDVDLENGTWRIPADNSKNGKEHVIFLSDFSVKNMQKLQEINGLSAWCFPAQNVKKPLDCHVCVKSISKQLHDRQRATPMKGRSKATNTLLLSGGEWTPHDLRRTGATVCGSLGVRPDVIEKMLNHVEQNKLVRIYQRQELKAEQRAAWRLLGERLEVIAGSTANVVTIQRAA